MEGRKRQIPCQDVSRKLPRLGLNRKLEISSWKKIKTWCFGNKGINAFKKQTKLRTEKGKWQQQQKKGKIIFRDQVAQKYIKGYLGRSNG